MALKTKADLKSVFNGPASLLYQSAALNFSSSIALDPTLDVPCKVDTLEFEQGEPNIEHYKVIGLSGDWVSSSEAGDITVKFRVPTKAKDILELAFGSSALKAFGTGTGETQVTYNGYNWSGDGVVLTNHKVTGTWAILNDAGNQMVILNHTTLYASIVMDNDAKGVVAVDFSGTIESDGTNPDVLFLTKGSATA